MDFNPLNLLGMLLAPLKSLLGVVAGDVVNTWKGRFAFVRHLFKPKDDGAAKPESAGISNGVFFGRYKGRDIVKPEHEDGHVLIVGGPGSGKSSCIAIPTLRRWKGSVFAIDIKGELFSHTQQYRPNIKVFNPQDENSYGYDPYIFLNKSRNPAQEARAIAQAVIPLPPENKDPFWIESAQTVLTGVILHYHEAGLSFIETLTEAQSQSPQELIETVSESDNEKARLCVSNFAGMGDKALSGVMTELSRGIITLVTDSEIVAALSREKVITPADLEDGKDVFLNIPEHLLRQWKNLLTLIVNQFLTFFERRGEYNNRPILFLLDEFPRLGKIPAIIDGLATLRSKNITIGLIIQSLAQLDLTYGHDARKVIADTCSYKAILNVTEADAQDYFSRLIGLHYQTRTGHSTNTAPYSGLPTSRGEQTSRDKDRKIDAWELANLGDKLVLLAPAPIGFRLVKKQPYYEQTDAGSASAGHIRKRPGLAAIILSAITLGLYGAFYYRGLIADINTMAEEALSDTEQTQISYSSAFAVFSFAVTRISILLAYSLNSMFFSAVFLISGASALFYFLSKMRAINKRLLALAEHYNRTDLSAMLNANTKTLIPSELIMFRAFNELADEYNA